MMNTWIVRVQAILLLASAQASPMATRSGSWWLGVTREERLGYLAGYIDCAVWDFGRSGLAHASWYNLEPKISKRYASGSDVMTQPVASLLRELAPKEPQYPSERAEKHPGKHGMFDGNYWRQSQAEHRLGFVEGYMDCLRDEKVVGVRFSKPASAYVAQVSEWFGIMADDAAEVREDRVDTKIACALRQFRDK